MTDENPEMLPAEARSGLLRSSDQLDQLFTALSAAQGEMTDPAKDLTAKIQSTKGSYDYKYSDLSSLLKIVRPIFAKHGLALLQFPVNPHRGAVTIVTRIGHKSGQWIEGDLTLLVADDRPQTLGSAITYGRRYAAGGATGTAPDADEDGQVAQNVDPVKKGSWRGQRQDGAAATAGAMGAAEAQLKADLSKTKVSRGYDPTNPRDHEWLVAKLSALKVHEDKWNYISDALRGRAGTDLQQVIDSMNP